jgi:hypothetical protein
MATLPAIARAHTMGPLSSATAAISAHSQRAAPNSGHPPSFLFQCVYNVSSAPLTRLSSATISRANRWWNDRCPLPSPT